MHNLIEAHVQACDIISAIDDIDSDLDGITKKVGVSHLMVAASPNKSIIPFGIAEKCNLRAAENFCYFINDDFLNAVIDGEEDLNYLETLKKSIKSKLFHVNEKWKSKVDFIGLNYYRRLHV